MKANMYGTPTDCFSIGLTVASVGAQVGTALVTDPARRSFSELLGVVPDAAAHDPADARVTAVCTDSRQVTPGSLFIAIKGFSADGHRYVADAVGRGAAAIVYEEPATADELPAPVAAARVPDSRRAAALLATEFHRWPSKELALVGVTGTNGKTTVACFLESIFSAAGRAVGAVTTVGRRIAGESLPAPCTTPHSAELQELLRRMVDAGVTHAAMEVSSHALALDGVLGCKFDAAVFTNLTRDHLDFHGSLDEYLAAKCRLFSEYAEAAGPEKRMVGILNADDAAAEHIARRAACPVTTYGIEADAAVRARDIELTATGSTFALCTPDGEIPLHVPAAGRFNVYNAAAAAVCALAMGVEGDAVQAGLGSAPAVPGRFEFVREGQGFSVVVDYAHTPDGLRNVLRSARPITEGRLLCVFGCGGDRDRTKRPVMGEVATRLADFVIVTSDNPRSEDPRAIIDEILAGAGSSQYAVEPDREAAIKQAMAMARAGDTVVIAGKGHETYQQFRDHTVHFDDREVARQVLRASRG
ncbi:MAG: UDP-N-acetylmuramoyl-L-alanyl-D-glutamate--2,6-diaminopimelate ligase [Armatimonadota bacterium]|jgi:UDP-N-acetylmuramoyl-L-alanyl-D-glutamate--2,6-diaminopimelate ligase